MSPIQLRAQKIFARCFLQEDLEFLQRNAEFIQATENIETLADAFAALELGERLTSGAWMKLNYPDGFSQWVLSGSQSTSGGGLRAAGPCSPAGKLLVPIKALPVRTLVAFFDAASSPSP